MSILNNNKVNNTDNSSTTSFLYQAWLDSYPLTIDTVMDYFKYSPFYDRQCNNEVLAIQNRPQSHLISLKGLEYEVVLPPENNNDVFIIHKKYRHNEHFSDILAIYYILANGDTGLRGMVFPMPDIHSVCKYNLMSYIYYIKQYLNNNVLLSNENTKQDKILKIMLKMFII